MAKAVINAGACGFTTEIIAESEDMNTTVLKITSDCPNFKNLNNTLNKVDAMDVCFNKVGEGVIFDACRKFCKHAACPVPTAIIKAVEVECSLALPKDVIIKVTK
jgi:hypothetical protein